MPAHTIGKVPEFTSDEGAAPEEVEVKEPAPEEVAMMAKRLATDTGSRVADEAQVTAIGTLVNIDLVP